MRQAVRGAVAPKIKSLRDRLDDNEVRNARRLVRAVRSNRPPDLVAFGDSNWIFRGPDDTDLRRLPAMLADAVGPDVALHVCAGGGYHPGIFRAYLRQIRVNGGRPTVVVPLWARVASVAWSVHPRYTFANAIRVMEGFGADTPIRRIRAPHEPPTREEYQRYGDTVISTWMGDLTIDELRAPLVDPARRPASETERRRILYAYHHGERVEAGAPMLLEMEMLARELRDLDVDVIALETTCPVDEGVALWGEQFRENAANTFQLMREAFRRGYGDPIDIIESGLTFDRSLFIDPADGTEHLNDRGRLRVAEQIAERFRELQAQRAEPFRRAHGPDLV